MTYRILCQGRGFYFALGPTARPIVVTRKGSTACQPGGRHPFWRAVALWDGQGRRLSADGLCAWEEPKSVRLRRSGGAPANSTRPQASEGVGAA